MTHAIEEPRHTVVQTLVAGEVDVRQYAPYLVAEVVVPGPASEAGNQGFRLLAGYIFGRNKGERKIAMTAPVAQAPQPVKIEMTAPVTQTSASSGGTGYVVQFMMPASFTMETLPEPLDAQVQLREVPAERRAVITYSGTWSQANYDAHLAKLREAVATAGLTTQGEPVYARYNGPWVPWFLRRNEIWLALR